MNSVRIKPLLCALLLALATAGCSQSKLPKVEFSDTTLENGLRVIIVPEHTAPVFAISLTYNTGSRNEKPDRTGLAHLFEHMMFEGSANVGKGEHGLLVLNYGGTVNGSTNNDRTNYFEALPKNQLDMALFLESDRMRALNITQANLDNQRKVVQEERRLRVDNQPYGKSFEEAESLAYDSFPYHHSVDGSMEDLNAAKLDDVRNFFRIYYAPNNVVMVLAGDLDPKETLAKVKKYFGDIPRQPAPPLVDATEPEHDKERRKTLNDPLARLPRYSAAYLAPPGNTPDTFALHILAAILSEGRSSRLHQHLVADNQLALSAGAFFQSRRGPSLFSVDGLARPGVKVEDVEKAIDDEIEAIKRDGPTPQEMQKVRTIFLRQSIQTRASVLEMANLIGTQTVFYNDPNLINTAYEKLAAVTAEQAKQAAQKYLVPAHRVVVITVPEARGAVSGAAAADTKQLSSKVQRLNKAPINHEILKVTLPHPAEITLPNGLTVLVLEQHRLPTVYYNLWIKSGALSDPKDMPGLASFTADVLRDGTAKRDNSQIAFELDELGADCRVNAEFGDNLTTITSSGLTESADKVMEIMSDVVLNASFGAEELQSYQRYEGAQLIRMRSNPAFLARERFAHAVYGDFAASIQSPTLESLQKATPKALKAFHDKYYTPNNAILAISGDLTIAKAAELAKKYFGDWKSHPIEAPAFGSVTGPAAAKTYLIDRPGSVQSTILAGGLSLRRSDPDFKTLWVANRILGGASSARLYSNLSEEKGYTYDAFSRVSSGLFPGVFVANTEVRNNVTGPSLHELLYEFKRLRDERVPQAELEEAKGSIISSFALSLENPSRIAESWMAVKYYGLPADYYDKYSDQIAKVDADAVQRVARKYIDLDHLQVVVVGDAKQVREAVAKYGTVEVYDAEGKAVEAKTDTEPSTK
ncbi:MAG TPA: pitrilysin family protein [Candidatus Angelobacter sp.]